MMNPTPSAVVSPAPPARMGRATDRLPSGMVISIPTKAPARWSDADQGELQPTQPGDGRHENQAEEERGEKRQSQVKRVSGAFGHVVRSGAIPYFAWSHTTRGESLRR